MVYPAFRVRPMFPLKAAYFCPLLPHVDGFPILRVLRVDLTPSPPSDDLRLVGSPYLSLRSWRGSLKFLTLLFTPATL